MEAQRAPAEDQMWSSNMSCSWTHLFQDVLLSHQLLSLPVRFAHDHVQDRLAAVDHVRHEEDHVLQQLDGKPGRQHEGRINPT